jgi:hypothetical protein
MMSAVYMIFVLGMRLLVLPMALMVRRLSILTVDSLVCETVVVVAQVQARSYRTVPGLCCIVWVEMGCDVLAGLARTNRTVLGLCCSVVWVEMGYGTVAELAHKNPGGRIDVVDHNCCRIAVVVAVRVIHGHRVEFVRIPLLRRTLAIGSVLVNLACSRPVAHKAFHVALGLHADCGVARRLRAVLSRSLGCSRTHPPWVI